MIKQFFKDTPNSVFFWNGLVTLLLIIPFFISEDAGLGSLTLLVLASIIMMLGALGEGPDYKVVGYHYWMYLSPLVWVFLVTGSIIFFLVWLGMKAIKRLEKFNKWLNK